MPQPSFNAVVASKTEIMPGLALFRLRPEGWELPLFRAGQYAMVGLPGSAPRHPAAEAEPEPPAADKWIKKAYSISSAATEHGEIELYVVMVPTGQLTPRLFALEAGDRLFLLPRFLGDFTLEAPDDARVVLIGTGTGLAPLVSMIRTHAHRHCARRYVLFHGVRTSAELGFREEMEALAAERDDFAYVPCIDQPERDPEWSGLRGWVQDHWSSGGLDAALGGPPSPADTHVFLCGNPRMIETMKALLLETGYSLHSKKHPEGQVHVESFW
ncbi:MAG: ferredoxin--NADP reductase [Planctomycetota bacterium]